MAAALDPRSLILSQFSNFDEFQTLQFTSESSYFMERGPRYNDYAALRESKLRMKRMEQIIPEEEEDKDFSLTPPPLKKQVKFQGNFVTPQKRQPPKGGSILTQSVPDFSSALRKENRKPAILPPVAEKTLTLTPSPLKPKSGGRFEAIIGRLGGSKSVNSGEKKSIGGGGGLILGRKSYASLDDLKGLASEARNAINRGGGGGGGRTTITSNRGVGKTVLGYRQY